MKPRHVFWGKNSEKCGVLARRPCFTAKLNFLTTTKAWKTFLGPLGTHFNTFCTLFSNKQQINSKIFTQNIFLTDLVASLTWTEVCFDLWWKKRVQCYHATSLSYLQIFLHPITAKSSNSYCFSQDFHSSLIYSHQQYSGCNMTVKSTAKRNAQSLAVFQNTVQLFDGSLTVQWL